MEMDNNSLNSTIFSLKPTAISISSFYKTLNFISDVLGFYLVSASSFIGFFINLISLILLNHKTVKHKLYNTIQCSSICNLIVCIAGMGYLNSACKTCSYTKSNTHGFLFYQWYIIKIPLRMLFIASGLAEISVISNRCFVLYNKKNFFTELSKKKILALIYSIPVIISICMFGSIEIYASKGSYSWRLSKFGESRFMQVYSFAILIVETILPTFSLIILSIVSILKYKKIINNKKKVLKKSNARTPDNKFTKLIIYITIIYCLARFFDMLASLAHRVSKFNWFAATTEIKLWMNFFRQLTYFLNFVAIVASGVILLVSDKNLRKLALKKIETFKRIFTKSF